jgi:hypothetical protein
MNVGMKIALSSFQERTKLSLEMEKMLPRMKMKELCLFYAFSSIASAIASLML